MKFKHNCINGNKELPITVSSFFVMSNAVQIRWCLGGITIKKFVSVIGEE